MTAAMQPKSVGSVLPNGVRPEPVFRAATTAKVVKMAPQDTRALRLVPPDQPRVPRSPGDDLYQRFAPYVATVVMRLVGRRQAVEDLVQDVFVEAVRDIASLREPEAIRGWLSTLTVRLVCRRLRMSRLRRFLGLDDEPRAEIDDQLPHRGLSPEDHALLAAVFRVLEDCATADRVAWCLHRIHGETLERTAQLCGCSLPTIKRRIARTQVRIDARFADE
jgi:RNA polymerase sigma-70 factor (ECF subfamily)